MNSQTTIGVLPIGTMNNLARGWGIPLDIDDACEPLAMGVSRMIDIGRVHANEKEQIEYFLESAGLGLSAIALPAGQAVEKGRWSLLPKAVGKLLDYQGCPIEVELDGGQVIQADSQLVTVSNAPLMGKNILVAPNAKMDDGLLDVAIYDHMSKPDLLGYFMAASNGARVENPNVKFYRTRRVRIRTEKPVEVHSDKDAIEAKRELDIEIVPKALSVVVGQGIALSMPVEAVPSVPPLSGPQSSNGNGSREPGTPRDAETTGTGQRSGLTARYGVAAYTDIGCSREEHVTTRSPSARGVKSQTRSQRTTSGVRGTGICRFVICAIKCWR